MNQSESEYKFLRATDELLLFRDCIVDAVEELYPLKKKDTDRIKAALEVMYRFRPAFPSNRNAD